MSSSATLAKPQQRLIQSSYCSCSKFVPQAFNSNKCQTCFNTRDSHTSEALADFQKSNRKVCKFGYLFIAPSDLELNKTKRWQWRFFVFYDDGELTYSLDDNPLTVPQGRINMSMCEHIAELSNKADFVSYPNSLCLKFAKPLKDMYIAAGNYEEMIKWKDVICSYASKCQKKNFLLISQKLEEEIETENENVPERDTTEKNESQEEESKEQTSSESVSDDSNRRLSYKEDDLIRKQRLKENLNQLLIEYKHEEEANMKKMSKQIQQNRQSLPQTSRNKSSAFSLVAPPTNNSAFRPVNSLTNLLSNQNSLPLQMQSNKLNKTQSSSAMISSNKNNSPSSSCSWSSSAKPRPNEDCKKPCLISPRKQTIEEDSQPVSPNLSSSSSSSTSSTKSLTIRVQTDLKQQQQELDATLRNIEIIDLTKNSANSTNSAANSKRRTNNLIGYLWKLKDSNPTDNTSNQFNKYWFSLNMNLCCLIYWNDKYEQDIGKFPIGKFELTKCCQIFPNDQNSNTNDFRLSFHQNTSTLTLRASSHENKIAWCDSIRSCIENQPNQCTKCKPKLVVNPMPAFSNSTTPTEEQMSATTTTTTTTTATTTQPNQQMCVQISQTKLPSQITPRSECQSYEALKNQHEQLIKDNSDLHSKFKILEQIHLDSVAEYDQQQSRLYNQLDELAEKVAKSENELDLANKKAVQSKSANEASLNEIKKLNETIDHQQKELDKLNKKLCKQLSSNAELGWNKEVKNLDARISDVLGKIKERELNLAHKNDEALKLKCERLQRQLVEAQSELLQLKQEKSHKAASSNLHDFSDDLTKVLMSKEEVIGQLEAQIRDKDRQICDLTLQLNEEISKSDKFQDAFNLELDRNNQLKSLADNLNDHYAHELNEAREELKQSKCVVEKLESRIRQINDQKDKSDTELKNAHESAKNEIETLQEETKTLEFKLVHSQRQAQEYQTILEDMDMQNSHTINQLNQMCANMDACVHNLDLNTSSGLHNRLKRNQSCVNLLTKQILELKDKSIDELANRLKAVQCECDALKEENIDLNDHIYSIDVYMREKEAECDQLKKEKDELVRSLSSDDGYKMFLNNLTATLKQKTSNMDGLVKFCENIYLCDEQLDEALVLELVPEQQIGDKRLRKQALKDKAVLALIKNELNELVGYLECAELNELNSQVTSYMAEQLIHKAALNGNLKFACEVLRKKRDAVSDGAAGSKVQSPSGQVLNVVNVSEQDEKIFKLASELLLSDEDSLRKLSAQVLTEVQHLTQLNCVVNTLKKLRLRYLSSANGLGVMNKICAQLNSECEQASEEQATEATTEHESEQISFILEVIRDIFIQHKNQVSDQLSEVHKLMSISSFNDLVAHLQNENSVLKKELSKLQGKMVSNSNFLDKNFGNRILSSNNFQSKSGSQLRKFGLNADNATQNNQHSHHILTDLLGQDDTMC